MAKEQTKKKIESSPESKEKVIADKITDQKEEHHGKYYDEIHGKWGKK